MGRFSKNVHEDLLNYIFTATGYTPPAGIYLSLHTADPGDTGANEVNYTGYSGAIRPAVVFTTSAASRAITHDNTLLSFPLVTAGSMTGTHYGLWDSATVGSGNFIGGGSLTSSLLIEPGNTPNINGGELVISWDAGASVGMTTVLANKLLDLVLKGTAYTKPVIELALFTTTCTDSTPGTECAGANYARILVPNWDAAVQDTSDVYTQNTGTDAFTSPSDDSWGTIVACAVHDNTSGDQLFYGNDLVDLLVLTGVAVRVDPGQLKVRLS